MTAHTSISTLRFEDAPITLGDELRGARATLNKSLEQIEDDLKIRSAYILAIERGALDELPDPAYASGFVRAYARYLGLNGDTALRRFQQENGLPTAVSPAPGLSSTTARAGSGHDALAALALQSKPRSGFSALRKAAALIFPVLVIAGLGYAAWTLFQNSGDTGPTLTAAPAEPVPLPAPAAAAERPTVEIYEQGVARYWSAPPPAIKSPDGPIVDLAVNYALRAAPVAEPTVEAGGPTGPEQDAAAGNTEIAAAPPGTNADAAPDAPVTTDAAAVTLYAEEASWVRITSGDSVVFTGTLQPGQEYEVPADGEGHALRAGNAGALFLQLNGERIGAFGNPGGVVKNVPLDPAGSRAFIDARIAARSPAQTEAARPAAPAETTRRATPAPADPPSLVVTVEPAPAPAASPRPAAAPARPAQAPSIIYDTPSTSPITVYTPAPERATVGFGRMNPVE